MPVPIGLFAKQDPFATNRASQMVRGDNRLFPSSPMMELGGDDFGTGKNTTYP
ncbi:hypothetical protein BFJ63_vAg16735 [Fusarium oxysporum f. sp. narcissi]|uniref:Uncharacterized protein n=1 Tax=Fusarium oxysporum f. sp. narcissi TaxID=451672 RepID=A0A4Q2V0L7_FUSOX|nr:hypothetical protein BFJ63_vAg16735 [Fusarium oxysporum f. sp. narcissi]